MFDYASPENSYFVIDLVGFFFAVAMSFCVPECERVSFIFIFHVWKVLKYIPWKVFEKLGFPGIKRPNFQKLRHLTDESENQFL